MLSLILTFFSIEIFGQVDDFVFEGEKTYPNGKKIAYFHLQNIKDQHQAYYVQTHIDVQRFSVVKYSTSTIYCMTECDKNINEDILRNKINQEINDYNSKFSESTNLREFYLELYSINNMPEYIDTNNRREDVLKFKEKFEIWKTNNPEEYKKIQSISIDIFIQ